MSIAETTPAQFVKLVDMNFKEYAGKISRLDLKWGQWSVIMNREIRRRIEAKTFDMVEISLVYSYWVMMSQLLELKWKYKGKLFGASKIKKKVREAKLLRSTMKL